MSRSKRAHRASVAPIGDSNAPLTVLIQEIGTFWTKASRGAPAAARRGSVPEAAIIPTAIATSQEPHSAVHSVRYDEVNSFEVALRNDVRVVPFTGSRSTVWEENIAVSLTDNTARVDLVGSWGAPVRYPARGILALQPNQWGRVRYNYRYSGYDDPWRYASWVINIGLFATPAPDCFLTSQPVRTYSNMADLW